MTAENPGGLGRRLLEAGFGKPRGVLGRLGGWSMARGNAATERHLVDLADPDESEAVLVVGFGPGVGLREAGLRSARVVGVDPSPVMRRSARHRCADLVRRGRVGVEPGTAEDTGAGDGSIDVVLSVNNVQIWPDVHAGLVELHRALRPGGRLLISAHQKWLTGGVSGLMRALEGAGFDRVRGWTWEPPGRTAGTAAVLSARRP
ncbi:class I SAM-dependent methyltransferase [Nocardiopsis sp. HNM0947]|uniref:Class I SAM-dependent methyltransferase n=1 Tax=Nocardiopsis coralli TaxID=2772213 RepID=A0ABR9PEM3_9ACTN|nr:class I SAM-dependent methyltransferase [Nocardiopsis coralli]MBE3002290.1 class I SAM-dependent methyltransferase [Nocardiopsis coralli]